MRSSLSFTPDAVGPRLVTITFTTAVFRPGSLWRFEASSYKAAPEDLPPSHGRCAGRFERRMHPSPSLPCLATFDKSTSSRFLLLPRQSLQSRHGSRPAEPPSYAALSTHFRTSAGRSRLGTASPRWLLVGLLVLGFAITRIQICPNV